MGSPTPGNHLRDELERYRTLLEINNAIITNLTEDLLLHSISKVLHRVMPFDRAALTLYVPEKDAFRFLAVEGTSDYFRPGLEIGRSESSVGWVFDRQQPIVRHDLEKEQQYANERRLAAEGMRSHCVVPLIVRTKCIGTLNVASGAEGQYSTADAELLREIANQVALAIENMRSYGDIASLSAKVARSAERWRAVFENSAIGVALTDLNGRFMAANRAYQKMMGYTEEELRTLSFLDITHEDYRESNKALLAELLEGKRDQYQIEKQYRRKDGNLVWGSTNVTLVPGTESMPRFILGLAEDVTERKRAEESLRKSEERRRTLLEINNAIITKLNQNELFHAICDALKRVVPFGRVALILHDPATGVLRITALEGPFWGENFAVGYEVGPESVSGWVFNHRRALLRKDLETEAQYATERLLWVEGIRSLCALPLIVREEPSGVLFVASATKGQYSEHDVSFLQEVANQVALAIGNMKSYEEIGALNKQVARTVDHLRTLLEINNAIITNLTQGALLRSISKALGRVIPFDRCAITLYKPESGTFRFLAVEGALISDYFQAGLEVGHRETSAGWVFDHRQPLLRRDLEKEQQFNNERRLYAEGIRSLCAAPLIFQGKCIGTLSVVSRIKDQYSEGDAQFLQEVANQVALAIENMRAYEEIAGLKARLEKENIYLREEIRTEGNFEEMVGTSPALLAVLRKVDQVAPTDSTVLIHGETGTGKELIARAIHDRSARKNHPLVKVNCSAISAGLVESELFGHVKGAFTGALERRIGRFEYADGGTIFLDEVGELPLETQVKLLRVLQEREFEPVGSNRSVRVDVRVIAATNRDLEEAVQAGRFRSDLFYRLNVFPIEVPPLRERRSDIPQLVTFFASRFSKRFGKKLEAVAQETLDRLVRYAWPGNIRELQNVIERAVVLSQGPILELGHDLAPAPAPQGAYGMLDSHAPKAQAASTTPSTIPTLEEVARSHILAALQQTGGVIEGAKGAARILNVHPNTLRHRMRKLGIKRHRPS
jgi:formate hydrogenlyase transcriptional activator